MSQTKRRHSRRRRGGAVANIPFLFGTKNMLGRTIHDKNMMMRLNETNKDTINPGNYVVLATTSNNANHVAKVANASQKFKNTKKNFKTARKLFRNELNFRRARIPNNAPVETNNAMNLLKNSLIGKKTWEDSNRLKYSAPRPNPTPSDRIIKDGELFSFAQLVGLFKEQRYDIPDDYNEMSKEERKKFDRIRRPNIYKYIIEYIKSVNKTSDDYYEWLLISTHDRNVHALVKFKSNAVSHNTHMYDQMYHNDPLSKENREKENKAMMDQYGNTLNEFIGQFNVGNNLGNNAGNENVVAPPYSKFSEMLREIAERVGQCVITKKEAEWWFENVSDSTSQYIGWHPEDGLKFKSYTDKPTNYNYNIAYDDHDIRIFK